MNPDVGDFYAGMLHPLSSAEHCLPMVALAYLASQCGRKAGLGTMVLFPLCLVAGIFIGAGAPILGTAFHLLNLAALTALGLLILFAHRITVPVVAVAAVFMGLVLGSRSGIDMAAAAAAIQFIPGVGLTGLITMTLIAVWVPPADKTWQKTLRKAAGGYFTLAGFLFLNQLLFGGSEPMVRAVSMPNDENLTLMLQQKNLSLPLILSLFIGATGWGAAHAFTPGHGKAIVGAYLVGARASGRHALYLGLTVTATHTLGVFTLGLVTLFASHYIVADHLYPWLGAISGFLVLAIGVHMLLRRWAIWRGIPSRGHHHHHHDHRQQHIHDHNHDHNHPHHEHGHHYHDHSHLPPGADGTPVTWKSLFALGISGGLLPCPAALILLLAAVSQHRTVLGLALVLAFSLGLAGVLTVVGLLFVKGGRVFDGSPRASAVARFLPVVSSLVIALLGALITIQSAARISF